ncbi:HK97-gp10 family putative phage morphogenesis protein [Enterococcus faecalis]|uniref:HK97-gp10 family putative phage morphogenesis protein n=1 Tax=Enterococcus faecalis TaxID=1351 RepID=UPI003D11FBB3
MTKKVTFKGVSNFLKGAQRYSEQTQNEISNEIKRSTFRVERTAKQLAPFDTGHLSNSIFSESVSKFKGQIVSPVNYSIYQEEGTRYMRAHPYMKPSLLQEKQRLFKNLNRIMKG